jgi:Mimiviridae putative ATP-dependent RNA helicase
MIEWLSEHDETSALTGSVERVRVGKPSEEFFADYQVHKADYDAKGFKIFETKEGFFVKVSASIVVEPPCVKRPCPKPPKFLWDWQKQHFRDTWETFSKTTSALDGSDTGTGKTVSSIAFALEVGLKIFVVCPMSAIAVWRREIKKYHVPTLAVGNYEYFKGDNEYGEMQVQYQPGRIYHAMFKEAPPFPKYMGFKTLEQALDYLMIKTTVTVGKLEEFEEKTGKSLRLHSRQIKGYKWKLPRNTLVIFDEVHRCKATDSQNMRLLAAAKPYVTLALSATAGTSPRDFRALGYVLGLHSLYDFDIWTRDHGCKQNHWRGWDYLPASQGMEKLNSEIYPAHGMRMRIAEIPEFPETQILAEEFSAKEAPELQKAYEECVKACSAEVKGKSMIQISALLKYRQKAEALKVPLFISLIEEAVEQGFSVPMFVNFTDTLKTLKEHFPSAPVVFGGQSGPKGLAARELGVRLFQEDKERVILLNIQAGGEAIDLHDVRGQYRRMSLISPTYNGFHLKQVFGRVRRGGSKSKSIQRLIYMADTVEREVCEKVREKLKAFDALNGELQAGVLVEDRLLRLTQTLDLSMATSQEQRAQDEAAAFPR